MRGLPKCAVPVSLTLIPLVFAGAGQLPPENVLDDPAFDHFYNLEYDEALAGFVDDARKAPQSPDVQNHIAQAVLFRAMFRGGMLQSQMLTSENSFLKMPKLEMSPADRQQFEDAIQRALELAQTRLANNPNDPAALYALGVSYGLRGNYDFAVRKAYLDALHDIGCARKFHNRVTRIDPALVDAELTQAVYDYVAANLSMGWKMLGLMGGFQGNRARGIAALNRVASEGGANRIDATIILAAIYRREHRSTDAICVLKPLTELVPRNYLLRLELAEMYADVADHGAALDVLEQVEQLQHAPGYGTLSTELLRRVRERILVNIDKNSTIALR
jgi:tetratricopeptide (TPR) repeat protein